MKIELAEKGNYIWHPLTQHKTAEAPLKIESAKGVFLYDADGKEYIDAISSWYTAVYGHLNSQVLDKVKSGMESLDQVVFTGFTHKPAQELANKLFSIVPKSLEKMFFSDNGSTSVDTALKMALQYWYNQGLTKRKIIAFEGAFHGDTFGAMSASDLDVYNGPFKEFLLEVERIPVPNDSNIDLVLNLLENSLQSQDVICFIYEPLVQGAAGMKMHKAEHLDLLLKLVHRYDSLCVADEVMTGFGKTGTNFASDQVGELPDIMCLSKALTCGLVPMGLTLSSQKVYDAFYDQDQIKGFFHGHTYSANPMACNAAIAGIELLNSDSIKQGRVDIEKSHLKFVDELMEFENVLNPRSIGVILAFELKESMERYGSRRNALYSYFMSRGVYLRPLGNTIYILPPYIISNRELDSIYTVIRDLLSEGS
jgi:adenosylmethionine-8-amino-7-oxononanoate aminotransferase